MPNIRTVRPPHCTHTAGICDYLVCPRETAARAEDRRLARLNDDIIRHQVDGRFSVEIED